MAEVETSRDGSVLTITLNRPDSYNAFTTSMHAALRGALAEAASEDVRAVVITGAGKGFCAGQDIGEFSGVDHDIGGHLEATYHPNIRAIRSLEKPVIAAVNGAAAGAGLSLACACDYRIAADSAASVPGFIGIGLVPDSGGSYFIARLLGASRAFTWMSSNRKLTAADVGGHDCVMHLAAISNDPMGELDPNITLTINRDASINLAHMAKQAGVPRYLFASSCSMYGAGAKLELSEGDPLNPLTTYARSKIETEQEVTKLADANFSPAFMGARLHQDWETKLDNIWRAVTRGSGETHITDDFDRGLLRYFTKEALRSGHDYLHSWDFHRDDKLQKRPNATTLHAVAPKKAVLNS